MGLETLSVFIYLYFCSQNNDNSKNFQLGFYKLNFLTISL